MKDLEGFWVRFCWRNVGLCAIGYGPMWLIQAWDL